MSEVDSIAVAFPTYNEVGTVEKLTRRLQGLNRVNYILDVDDGSFDGTLDKIQTLQSEYRNIHLLLRPGKLGFGTAIRDGFKYSLEHFAFDRLVQMDADLSHNPAYIPTLLSEEADIVVGSRYVKGGGIVGWRLRRKLTSSVANLLARYLLRLNIRDVTSGFRVYSRHAVRLIGEQAISQGYEFEIEALWLAKKNGLTIREVPIVFTDREQGKSKLSLNEILRFLGFVLRHAGRKSPPMPQEDIPNSTGFSEIHLTERGLSTAEDDTGGSERASKLRAFLGYPRGITRSRHALKFGMAGTFGILVNEAALWILTGFLGIYYLISAIISSQASITSNFALNDSWVFSDRKNLSSRTRRYFGFNAVASATVLLRIPILWVLTSGIGINYLSSNLVSIIITFGLRFFAADSWVWRKTPRLITGG